MAMRSTSSLFSYGFTYDVFLSFRGEDTRYGFTGNLYKALCDRGIHTFIDDEELQRGDEITPALEKAIEESRIFTIVLSQNYASSSFCLNELAYIFKCVKSKGLLVLPVFYNVDPSDVRHHGGSFGEALANREEKFKANKEGFEHNKKMLETWKIALHQVANLSGYHFKHGDGYEYTFIGKIVEDVSSKINRACSPFPVADFLVGLESQVLEVRKLLDVGSDNGVLFIGIHGIGGIGKTTLATAVYNSIADHFDGLCFLENVRENSNKHGLQHLQSILLSKILGEKEVKLASVGEGTSMMLHRLQRKKVLLILDDVDKHKQLQAIVGRPDWFGPGSRVIITTRDKHLLACHEVKRTYEVKELNEKDAIQFLCWKAFKKEEVDPRYVDVLNHVVTYASGLPLALEVIGSNLFGKSVEEWESAINQYKRIPINQIFQILRVSFDALEEEEKSVFLDIACCFKWYGLAEVEDILLAHHGKCMKYHIGVLVEISLIKLSEHGTVTLHDLIEDMGKEIVRQEAPKDPGQRSRLWSFEDIIQVLEDNRGTRKIEIICLNFSFLDKDKKVEWNGKAFKKMKNPKTLIIRSGLFSKGPKHLPNSIRVLEWWKYPSQGLPPDFHPKKLAICKLPHSCFGSLGLADLSKASVMSSFSKPYICIIHLVLLSFCSLLFWLQKFTNVTVLNFDSCEGLTHIPDVSGLPNLEKFSFQRCYSLISVHDSIGFLDKLKLLNVLNCCSLKSFPPLKLISLEKLELSACFKLENFPEILGKMENITRLQLSGTSIKELPLSFQNLTGLQTLNLGYGGMFRLPSCIVMMPKLGKIIAWNVTLWTKQVEGEEKVSSMVSSNVDCLHLLQCKLSDEYLPICLTLFANVKELDLSRTKFTVLPECISQCHLLWKLNLDWCRDLQDIRGIPPKIKHFSALYCLSLTSTCRSALLNQELHEHGNTVFLLPGATVPEWFELRSRRLSSSFWFRNKFPSIALCAAIGPEHNVSISGLMVTINGNACGHCHHEFHGLSDNDHTYLFDLQKMCSTDDLNKGLIENKWNRVEIRHLVWSSYENKKEIPALSGIYIFKQRSSMEDIRFTDPYKKRKLDDVSET